MTDLQAMANLILVWLVHAASLLLVANLLPGIEIDGFGRAMLIALVLGFINSVIRPVLQLLALPISVLTLGFFALVINGLMFGLAAYMLEGFSVAGFWPAFFGALLYSITTWAANTLLFSPRGAA